MAGEDDFVSAFPSDYLDILLEIGAEKQFDPTSEALEPYFVQLVAEFESSGGTFRDWVIPRIEAAFRCVSSSPEWIQNPDWQVGSDGRPLWFVGEVLVPAGSGVLHDEGCFYVFWDPNTGEMKTILQVA